MSIQRRTGRVRRDGRITAVTFSLNEAELLPECLARLTDFDELLVCNMQSVDDTVSVATRFGAHVIEVPFVPIAESVRQLALDVVHTEWALFVDADEHVPRGFRASLKVSDFPPEIAAVRLYYDNFAFGVRLAHTLRGSAKYALLRPDLAHYESDSRAHVPPVFDGPVMDAPPTVPHIQHLNFRSVHQSMEKVLRYAESDPRGAQGLVDPIKLPRELAREIIGGGAWRDGRAGVILVTLNAIGRFYSAALEWESRGYEDTGWTPGTRRLLLLGGRLHQALRWLRKQARRTGTVQARG